MSAPLAYQVSVSVLLVEFRPDQFDIGRHARLATVGFRCPRLPLEGTPFAYQLAISRRTAAHTGVGLDPNVPGSGDSRSGVIVFDADKIVGSYVLSALRQRQLAVAPGYRGKGLAVRMVEQWIREVRATPVGFSGTMNEDSARVAVSAHRRAVAWAVANGKSVPDEVASEDPQVAESATVRFRSRVNQNSLLGRIRASRRK